MAGGLTAGRYLMRNNQQTPQPEPYVTPIKKGEALNQEAAVITEGAG